MDPVRELIVRRLRQIGLTMREASLRIGRNHAYLQQFIRRGVPAELDERARVALAALIGVSPDDLRARPAPEAETAGEFTYQAGEGLPPGVGERAILRQIPIYPGLRDLPVYGAIKGGIYDAMVDLTHVVAMTFRPPELVGVKGAFGLFNVGDAMSPRYEHGDLCWVNPALPVREGHYVAVEFKDGTAVVRRFVRRKNSQIQIEQLNPHEVVTLPADKVANLYRVIGAIEAR